MPTNSASKLGGTRVTGDYQSAQALTISLPEGGVAIRRLEQKFANPVTSAGTMTIPTVFSPGRSGFGRLTAPSYDFGAGAGTFGFGRSLRLPLISRATDLRLPRNGSVSRWRSGTAIAEFLGPMQQPSAVAPTLQRMDVLKSMIKVRTF